MEKIIINEENPYSIFIGTSIYTKLLEEQFVNYEQVVLFIDNNVTIDNNLINGKKVYGINATETNKSLLEYEKIISFLLECNVDRKGTLFVAIGGGITLDLVGYVASTYKRGVDLITVPTTLLSMVDVAVGSKNAINFGNVKNCVGTFYSPKMSIVDLDFLVTLDDRNFNNGMAEVIKHGAIKDVSIIQELLLNEYDLETVIKKSISVKKYFVEADGKDKGIRKALNFGHTYGHALESYYSYEKYMHGEAVSIGMNLMYHDEVLQAVCKKFELPVSEEKQVIENLQPYLLNDKKNEAGEIGFVYLDELGKVRL